MKTRVKIKKFEKHFLDVAVVIGSNPNVHDYEYQLFDISVRKNKNNIYSIGVKNNQIFKLFFKSYQDAKFAFSVYLDGVNVIQENGILSLNDIPEKDRQDYDSHHAHFIFSAEKDSFAYIDRYSQVTNKNRVFKFTKQIAAGINENLINDLSLENRIDIYIWQERNTLEGVYFEPLVERDNNKKEDKLKIGAGYETFLPYESSEGLENNKLFLDKITIIYKNKDTFNEKTLIPFDVADNLDKEDPMDKIPW